MMARIRTVKPEFWSSEQVMSCTPLARLLFICTSSQNSYNRSSYRDSKFLRGVYQPGNKGRFRARITADRKVIELGAFHSEQEAHEAYLSAAKRLHGDFKSRCSSAGVRI